ncbi:MAG: 2Fe-2S iron-sulfur cluster binding domain-containing protein [Candidatus Thiodiazotropha sp. (ex Lucinoma aequizonata)]|nr:2Fe-2S iron-sulfur cluster binding domain-containing protein [Candidatus Thiodiazotropha sp. (ex Lucinoma aequizonata)]MCU7887906.1 2Fe-2S iron-sulfur cluster binding domain-containing protein [Candidatus Thiodiazotropha sp. (ex Lucinoma aequizonata)]MCU7895558.1 2Fe-2S iron-sulfur cluster binding domain-containing protein [Candidatus Thiodiazotropha sp. (ex Lucinoma aequizonata)]MCU7898093.1 2Fe-2S iron-sulfur cluster binding domain-containing protein [Candidatus Thiodiazotropha sp. (ex Luci
MTVGTLVLIIVAALLLQVSVMALVGLFRRKRQYREINKRTSEPQALPVSQQLVSSNSDIPSASEDFWDGFREFSIQRREIEDGNRSICSFYLTPVDGLPLPAFKPGQFLTFRLPIEDPATAKVKEIMRCYSLSNSPRPDYYRVSIKRVPPPANQPDVPPGRSSNYFHDRVREGMRLSVKAPSGHFHLMEQEQLPIVLVGGGICITPMLSIVNTLLDSGSPHEIRLFYGVRNGSEHIMKGHLETLAKEYPNFHLHVCYSRPGEQDAEGADYQHRGHVDIKLLRLTLQLKRHQFYICGPRAMLESLVPALEVWGVATDDIYYEAFGSTTLPKHKKAKPQSGKPAVVQQAITVSFSKSGKSIAWNPEAESLLEFAEDNNIDVDSGCRAGGCGSCLTELASGEVDYNQDPDANVEVGHCLLCISKPKSDLTLIA